MLQGLEWLREHSRIWGLAAIVDFDLSLHNPAYRAVARFFTEPKGELRKLRASLAVLWPRPCSALPISGRASVGLQSPAAVATLEQKRQDAYTPGSAVDRAAVKVGRSADSKLASASSQSAGAQRGDHHVFNAILADTLASLLSEMKQECEKSGCRLVVQALPYRSTLLPLAGAATGYSGLDYTGERQILSRSCNQLNIPLIDSQTPAESLSTQGRQALFYGHHLTPQGHKFVAESMCEFLRQQLTIAPNI
jgi:hypothetical protein